MRGSLVHRGKKGSKRYALVLDFGYVTDPATGVRKRKQKWIAFRGDKKKAEDKLTELVRSANRNEFVEPSKLTLVEQVRDWLAKAQGPSQWRPETVRVYRSIADTHIAKAPVGCIPVQKLRPSDLEGYYASLDAAPATVATHHAIVRQALDQAVRDNMVTVNVATQVRNRQRTRKSDRSEHAREHCWSATEARKFLDSAKTVAPQLAAFFALALDTGARKGELHGLLWNDIDLDGGTLTIERQLDAAGEKPVFGPTKTKHARRVSISAESVALLRTHKKTQAALKMKNRKSYADFGLVFAKEDVDLQTPTAALGQPLRTLGESAFEKLVKAAGVKPIKFHGLRHTCASLLLEAGVPVNVVAQRLGHAKASMTLDVYSHVMPGQQQQAAATLGAILHG